MPRISFAAILALALAFSSTAPTPARAGKGEALGVAIVGLALICATNPKACGGGRGGGGGGGPRDAVALSKAEAMMVQEGLRSLGYYTGVIDGALGGGSRRAIKAYQASIGETQNGVMTGKQINDLVALSPDFASLPADSPLLFNADLARDVDREGLREIQSRLNDAGYNAGPVDGSWGGKTRGAVTAYKADNALPGKALPTRRLLAHLRGEVLPHDGGMGLIADDRDPAAQDGVFDTEVASAAQPGVDLNFDLFGVLLGMGRSEARSMAGAELGAGVVLGVAEAAMFAGSGDLSEAELIAQPNWPDPGAEMLLLLYSAEAPELGVTAAFRLIAMPANVDEAVFREALLPDVVSYYGEEGRVPGTETWIGNGAARAQGAGGCGTLALADLAAEPAPTDALMSGTGLRLDADSLASVTRACGPVLDVAYEGGVIRMGLWNSDLLAGGGSALPVLKF